MKTLSVFLVLVLMVPVMLRAEAPNEQARRSDDLGQSSTALVKQVGTYDQLLAAVRETRSESRVRVEKAVEQEKVREAWEIGKLIDAHVLQHKERADYAKQVLPRLAGDLGMSERELYYMLKFYRAYPILPSTAELSWGHYRELLSVNDPKERETVASEAVKNKWSEKETREAVRKVKARAGEKAAPAEILTAQPGKPGTYKIILARTGPYAGKLALDLGFSNHIRLAEVVEDTSLFIEGDILNFTAEQDEIRKNKEADFSKAGQFVRNSPVPIPVNRGEAALFTYRAWVQRVLDGDTIEAVVDLGFGITTTQTLRLRGIDAPEIATRDGMEAKKTLEKMFASSPLVLIKTVKSDKYDRYLVDVFIGDEYINNLLLKKGLAVRAQS